MTDIILFSSIFFWIFPAIRQIKGNYALYFVILALSDPIIFPSYKFLHIIPVYTALPLSLLTVFAIKKNDLTKNGNIKLLIVLAVVALIGLIFFSSELKFAITLAHLYIILVLLDRTLTAINEKSTINLFHLMLILYESTIVLKYIATMTEFNKGMVYFYLTSAFEALIAIFFTIFKEDSPKIAFPIKTKL